MAHLIDEHLRKLEDRPMHVAYKERTFKSYAQVSVSPPPRAFPPPAAALHPSPFSTHNFGLCIRPGYNDHVEAMRNII